MIHLRTLLGVLAYAIALSWSWQPGSAHAAAATEASGPGVSVVFLGTGTPVPDPSRQGPALAVVVGSKAFLVDAGTGVVRQAQAAYRDGIAALKVERLDTVFITHLHSDHTLGLADLMLTPWVMHRTAPLEVYGPQGVKAMTDNLLQAYREDIQVRLTGGEGANSTGYRADAHEIGPGVIYDVDGVKVTAFAVAHGSWHEALGYRFDAAGKSVVISGDTRPSDSVVAACHGCDLLVHEAYAGEGGSPSGADAEVRWMQYMQGFHTSARQLGMLAARAQAKRLEVTHAIFLGGATEQDMLADIRRAYSGEVSIAQDLDIILL